MSSDKSTTDNFQSDEDKSFKKRMAATKKKVDLEQERARSSSKFYWYWPQIFNQYPVREKRRLALSDDVSSDSSESEEELDEYLQECYYNAYLHYEQEARLTNHVVDVYSNFNPNHLWQNVYLHN